MRGRGLNLKLVEVEINTHLLELARKFCVWSVGIRENCIDLCESLLNYVLNLFRFCHYLFKIVCPFLAILA